MDEGTKLKIGLVLDTSLDPTDGVQQYVINVGEWLRGQGHNVHYLVGETKQRNLPNVHSLARNVKVRFNGNRTTIPLPTSRRRLRQFLDLERFDVLHVQVPHSPFMAQRLIVSAPVSTAVIGTFHIAPYGWLARLGNRALGIWLRPSLKRFDRMVSVSTAAADFASATFKTKTTVLPNVVDYKLYHSAVPWPEHQDQPTILFLGRLVARKGCQVLLQAIANLAADPSLPKFRVLICGQGHLEKSLRQFVKSHKLESTVNFTGFVVEADKPRYYASADIAVFPSSGGESFGIVLLEAMASGRAVVLAGDNPGYHSVLSAHPNLLFPPKSPEALAQKLKLFLIDRDLRAKLAKWGEEYTQDFDVSRVGPKLLAIYSQALRKRRNQ